MYVLRDYNLSNELNTTGKYALKHYKMPSKEVMCLKGAFMARI